MRILLIANYVPDAQQSMQRYASLLQDGFRKVGHEVRVLRPSVNAGKLAVNEAGAKWLGYIDKLVLFPSALTKALQWAEIVHVCDQSNAFYMKYIETQPHVVTCHDLLAVRSALGEFPEHRTRWSGRRLQRMIFDGLVRAKNIICVSDATHADVARILPGKGRGVTRIYNGLNYPWEPMEREEAERRLDNLGLASNQAFILHVGGNGWYKNRLGVLKIFSFLRKHAAPQNLVMVMAGKPWTNEMRQLAHRLELGSSAVELVDVAVEDLRALYSRAKVLLFPSLEEGFGWPIAEAQACGCTVVTSNRPPMTEVGGAAAIYVNPLDHESAAVAVADVLDSRRAAHGENLRNAARFSSATMIDAYLRLYSRLAACSESRGASRGTRGKTASKSECCDVTLRPESSRKD